MTPTPSCNRPPQALRAVDDPQDDAVRRLLDLAADSAPSVAAHMERTGRLAKALVQGLELGQPLARVAVLTAQLHDIGARRRERGEQHLGRQRGRRGRRLPHPSGFGGGERRAGGRELGAVDQRQTFLGLEVERLESGAAQRECRRHALVAEPGFAFADQGRHQMGERLLSLQKPQGFWKTGSTHDPEDTLDTCFSLLFLKRATRGGIPFPSITGGWEEDPADNRGK